MIQRRSVITKSLGLIEPNVDGKQLNDQSIEQLKEIRAFSELDIKGTKVTADGVAELQKALPNCKIYWDAKTDDQPAREE